ncbi:DUF433 domain-containing protein [Endozoicomonas sp. 4G]|uniref:DUF433 domain-containing protein n=1 Tax=Endozoicomonas sp. 4G TaxID=2872754 RepID=UPI0020788015|nr:DUF433 domain-containing protein [Endozoicomonas sp. 4G]
MIDSNVWIVCNPEIMTGKPCVKGTRITVESILEMLSSGMSFAEIVLDFPSLNETKIRAALAYAAQNLTKGDAA